MTQELSDLRDRASPPSEGPRETVPQAMMLDVGNASLVEEVSKGVVDLPSPFAEVLSFHSAFP